MGGAATGNQKMESMTEKIVKNTEKNEGTDVPQCDYRASSGLGVTMSIYKGNTANRLTWQSGTKTRDKGATIQLIYQGKYTALEAIQPEKADVLTGYAGYEVDKSHIVPQKGGMGILTIDMVEVAESVGTKPVGSISSVIEIEMAQLEKANHDASGF